MAIKTVQAIINGVTTTLTLNSSTGKYEATVTAPSGSSYPKEGHYYPVLIKATDVAGNTASADDKHATLGEKLKLKVKEKTAPVISITYPTAGAFITNNKPVIKWKVTDNDSGVNPSTIGITIDSGTKITGDAIVKTEVSGGYECSYTPGSAISDGSHTVKIDASDYDGNVGTAKSVTFKIDTVPPSLVIDSPVDGLVTNNPDLDLTGATNDATSSPVKVTAKLNSDAAQSVTVNENGRFNKKLKLADGVNTVETVATDAAGKTTKVVRKVTLDTKAPVIKNVTITPNPVDSGKTFTISVEVED